MKCRCILVIVLLGSLANNIAQAEALLGLKLNKSTFDEVISLLQNKGVGVQITEPPPHMSRSYPNSPAVVANRFLISTGGQLPGISAYNSVRFIFNQFGILDRYIIQFSIENQRIIFERKEAIASEFGNSKSNQYPLIFSTDFGAVVLNIDQSKNILIEDWKLDSSLALKPAQAQKNGGRNQCINICASNYSICTQPSLLAPPIGPSADVQQNFALTQCDSNYWACRNSCPQ